MERVDPYLYFGVKNSYRIITKESTLEDILDESSMQSGCILDHNPPVFFIEPTDDYTDVDIMEMIEVFEKKEEYEKCAQLIKLIKEK